MRSGHDWTFFTNHAHVMVCLVRNPDQPLREVALAVGITERAAHRIVTELVESHLTEARRCRFGTYRRESF